MDGGQSMQMHSLSVGLVVQKSGNGGEKSHTVVLLHVQLLQLCSSEERQNYAAKKK